MEPGPKTQPLKFTMHTNHDSTAVNIVISADIEHFRIIPYAGISVFTIGIIQNGDCQEFCVFSLAHHILL